MKAAVRHPGSAATFTRLLQNQRIAFRRPEAL
jgi:hypothetical protein